MFGLAPKARIAETGRLVGTGWRPPVPDLRDYTDQSPEVAELTKKIKLSATSKKMSASPAAVDLRQWCSPIEDQGDIGSCTAQAGVGMVEYFQRRAFDKHIEGSRLFVYKATRNLMGVTGDTGAFLRTTMGALALCGVPNEKFWPYTDADPGFDQEPSSFVYAIADNFEALRYFCHDPMGAGIPPNQVLGKVKLFLSAKIPAMFGFFGFPSTEQSNVPGGFAYPCPNEPAIWGHAVLAVGYDDKKKIKNTVCNHTTTGALLIRNSWGESWGEDGYGWLPYQFVLDGLAFDFWSLFRMEWADTGRFGL